MGDTVMQRAFAGGELAPALHARADTAKYATGLRTCRNFIIQRSGGVVNRPGYRFIQACKTDAASCQLMAYISELAGESLLIEAGADYFRFYKNGARVTLAGVLAWSAIVNYVIGDIVVSGGVNYWARAASLNVAPPSAGTWYPMPAGGILELPHAFGGRRINWHQSARTITLTHYDVAPYELIYIGLTQWILRAIVTGPGIAKPTALGLTPGAAGARRYSYIVTAASPDTYEESEGSVPVTNATVAAPTISAPHVLAWTPPAGGAPEYYVYCDPYGNGTYGFLGTATGAAAFKDIGFVPDFALTPPIPRALFVAPTDWPHHSSSYQQRRLFGHSHAVPDGVWGSRTGFPSNFGISSPLQDDDAITFRISGAHHNPVRHLRALKQLVVLTDAGGWIVTSGPQQPLTPSSIIADQEIYVGSADAKALVVGNSILYVQSRGRILRELRFDIQIDGLGGKDLTIYAGHLFDAYTVTGLAYQETPHSVIWVTRSDGTLLGLTYIPEQDIWGWHRHDTGANGKFADVCVVPESGQDATYVIVQRTIGGINKRYIERLEPREIVNFAVDAFFVDAGLTYNGAAISHVTGLDHLEGQVIAVLGDGAVVFNGDPASAKAATFTVTGGAVTLPAAYSVIHAGLPIRFAEIETLDLDVQGATIRDKQKKISTLGLLVDRSSRGFSVGPDASHLVPDTRKPWEVIASEQSGQLELRLTSNYNERGRILIRQTDPLPLTILGLLPTVEVGG